MNRRERYERVGIPMGSREQHQIRIPMIDVWRLLTARSSGFDELRKRVGDVNFSCCYCVAIPHVLD